MKRLLPSSSLPAPARQQAWVGRGGQAVVSLAEMINFWIVSLHCVTLAKTKSFVFRNGLSKVNRLREERI